MAKKTKKQTTAPTPPTFEQGAALLIEGFMQNTGEVGLPPPPEWVLSFIEDGFYAGAAWAMDILLGTPDFFDVTTPEGEAASVEYLKLLSNEINAYLDKRETNTEERKPEKNRVMGLSSLRPGGSA